MSKQRIGIIGAGSFGTALAKVFYQAENQVQVWAREAEIVTHINAHHTNPKYLSDLTLPDAVLAVSELFENYTRKRFTDIGYPITHVR